MNRGVRQFGIQEIYRRLKLAEDVLPMQTGDAAPAVDAAILENALAEAQQAENPSATLEAPSTTPGRSPAYEKEPRVVSVAK